MSATFKNAKKKLSQVELRRLMNEHKSKIQPQKKIESPLARYNDLGQLTCILCQSIIRSEAVWPIHVNSKQHRENVEKAKKLKERTNNFTTPAKRPPTPPIDLPSAKKIKGILKNAPLKATAPEEPETAAVGDSGIPVDFFDKNTETFSKEVKKEQKDEKMEVDLQAPIPEGFFDDPKQDAKARHVEYKDPIEEEWERFQKAIRDADNESAAIIAEDQEEATNERQIEEIEEQMKNWSRVLTLEQKKTEITINKEHLNVNSKEDSDAEDDFDEYLDWRSKRSFKH